MVQLTRPASEQSTVVPRDTTVAAVWHDLNALGLRVGAIAGFGASAAYLVLWLLTRSHSYAISFCVGIVIGTSGLVGIKRKGDMEIVLVTAAVGAISATSIATPIGRGGLWAAIAVITIVGALLLPDSKQPRFLTVIGVLIAGQLLWPVVGFAPFIDAIANVIVSGTCTAAGAILVRTAKRALDDSERLRIEMFRSVPVGLFRCAPSGVIIDANPALAAMLGHETTADLVDRQIGDLHAEPDDWVSLCDALEHDPEPRRFAHRMNPAHGEPIWVRGFAQANRNDDGEIIYLEGVIEDVTQRRRVEQQAHRSEERFRNVFERAPIAIWEEDYSAAGARIEALRRRGVTDLRSHLETHPEETRRLIKMIEFIDVNPAGIALIGAGSRDEALAGLDTVTMPDDVMAGFIEEFVAIWEDRDAMTIDIHGATMDGDGTDLALSWAVGRTPSGDLNLSQVIVAIQDIAIIRQAERDLAALLESKDELVASVSHELRTPITTILGMAFELRDHAEAFTVDEAQDLIAIIADQSRELSNIVEDLLVAAWSDGDTLAVRPEVVNVTTEIERTVTGSQNGPQVEIERPILAWTDPLRFRQILRNLLTNAGKYGGPNITVSATLDDDAVVVMVRDDGAGVPEEDRDRIFDPYFRAHADRGLPGSLGLGLPVSRRLARLMGGDLTYRFDGASVFELRLPAPIRGHFL